MKRRKLMMMNKIIFRAEEDDPLLDSPTQLLNPQEDRKTFTKFMKGAIAFGLLTGILLHKKESGIKTKEKINMKNLFSVLPNAEQIVNNFIVKHHSDLIKTTMKDLRKLINKAHKDGKSNADIAKAITKKFGEQYDRARSLKIARSMSTGVSNAGITIEMQRQGVNRKKWRATFDLRTRLDHIDTHEETHTNPILVHEYFWVGGWQAMYPADPLLPPEQAINCRCRVVNADFDDVRCRHGDDLFRIDRAQVEVIVQRQLRRYFRNQLKLIKKRIKNPRLRL